MCKDLSAYVRGSEFSGREQKRMASKALDFPAYRFNAALNRSICF